MFPGRLAFYAGRRLIWWNSDDYSNLLVTSPFQTNQNLTLLQSYSVSCWLTQRLRWLKLHLFYWLKLQFLSVKTPKFCCLHPNSSYFPWLNHISLPFLDIHGYSWCFNSILLNHVKSSFRSYSLSFRSLSQLPPRTPLKAAALAQASSLQGRTHGVALQGASGVGTRETLGVQVQDMLTNSNWWLSPTPLKNMSSSVGMMKFSIYGKS